MAGPSTARAELAGRELAVGEEIGPFTILGEIGRGSWAIVYDARHALSGEVVALKWMFEPAATPSLKREFRIARGLSHPHLVRLHEMHQAPAGVFFTMERVLGGDIVTRCRAVRDAGARTKLVRRLFADLALALQYLHAAAVVHRDIKPANVLVDAANHVHVVDFGLAESVGAAGSKGFSGTFAYAAPERLRGHRATPSSDWYSFGLLLFECIVGALPFPRDPSAALAARLTGDRLEVRSKLAPEAADLGPLLDALLDPSPVRRPDAYAVLRALGRAAGPTRSRRFVGRAHERRWLVERLATGGAFALTGAAGIGKTALVRAVTEALGPEVVTLASRCHPRENVPFNALDGAVASLLDRARRVPSRGALDPDVDLLERVFERPSSPAAGRSAAISAALVAGAIARLARAVTDAAASDDRPGALLVIVDDVQWTDLDSAALLEHLVATPGWAASWLLVARGAADAIPARIRASIRPTETLELGPLSAADGRALVDHVAPDLPEARAAELLAFSGAHPLSLVELASSTDEDPPRTFAEAMLRIAETRSPGQRDLLATLAVHDGPLDSDVLVATDGQALRRAYDLLDVGLVEFERVAGRYAARIRHADIADAIRSALDDARARAAHAGLAGAYARAQPERADARFQHLASAGRVVEAAEIGLDAARELRDRVALHRAIERYRWLLEHGAGTVDGAVVLAELAETQGRAGEAIDAGESFLALAGRDALRAADHRRAAAEQLLRGGDAVRGRALLARCLDEVGLASPRSRVVQAALILAGRAKIRAQSLAQPLRRAPTHAVRRRLEVAWSAGLGLNLVDVVASTLAQVQFTDLALREGSGEQIARAVGVEYSYAMITGGPFSSARARDLEAAMERLAVSVDDPYALGIMDLSRAAGDLFRGRPRGVVARIERARARFAESLGQKSWELANCAMYEAWARLEQGELERVARDVPECMRLARARGDALYKQCFVGGPSAAAWLVEGRVDELTEHLDELPQAEGGVSQAAFFALVARTRADFYRGRGEDAWRRLVAAWPRIERSGFLTMRWTRMTLAVLLAQAAIGARADGAERVARKWIARVDGIDLPGARAWALLLGASLGAEPRGADPGRARPAPSEAAALAAAERAFEADGMALAAQLTRHLRARRGARVDPGWPTAVASPDAFTRAMLGPLPGLR